MQKRTGRPHMARGTFEGSGFRRLPRRVHAPGGGRGSAPTPTNAREPELRHREGVVARCAHGAAPF